MSVLNFCKSSPWLKDGVPNIVLLIIPTNDVRFSGENSRFHNVLKNIAHLKIVDTQRPNLVVAFTWACSIPYKNEVKWKQAMEGKSLEISRIVRETLMVNAPIVWIENEYEDYELPKSEDHQQSRLPDDTWQPKNLFVAISKLLIENKDNLGLMAFKRFFTLSLEQKKRVKMGHFVKAKIAKNEQLSWKETKIMNSLRREAMVGSQLPQVTSMINEYLERRASTILQVGNSMN